MLVAVAVIAHRAALGDGFGVVERDLSLRRGGGEEQLQRVHRLAHVASAGGGDIVGHARGKADGLAAALVCQRDRPFGRAGDVGGGDGLELEDRRAAQNRAEHAEIRIFGRRGDQRDAAVLDELQQALLLLFVEILDLVKIQQHAARREQGVELGNDLLDVRDAGCRGVELAQRAVRLFRDDARDGRLARAGGRDPGLLSCVISVCSSA